MTKQLLHVFICLLLLTGCPQKKAKEKEGKPLPGIELQKSSFEQLDGWAEDSAEDAYPAFAKSCSAIEGRKGDYLGAAEIKIPLSAYQEICRRFTTVTPSVFKQFIEQNFTPYLVTFEGKSEGKFTSYYEAELHASRTKSEKYKYPIYGKPADLIEINPRDFDPALPSRRLVGRVVNQKLVPYYTRSEILSAEFAAPVILWADSYVDIYVMQIQGSAVAKLDDGSRLRIAYADNNGRAFKGIGSILLGKGLISPGEASMGGIKRWLKKQGKAAYAHMNENERFVFHRLSMMDGPVGALGVPLTAGRSLAVDKTMIPLGSLLWLETTGPAQERLHRLVAAQDIGGAIKGAVRGDYFWGSGGDEILELAGKMNSDGRYYILLPKSEEAAAQ